MKLLALSLFLLSVTLLTAQSTIRVHPAFENTEKEKEIFLEGIEILLNPQFQHNVLLDIAEETGIAAESVDSILEVTVDPYKKAIRVKEKRESGDRLDQLFATEFFYTTQAANIHGRMVRLEDARNQKETIERRIESSDTTEAMGIILERRLAEVEYSIDDIKSKAVLGPDPWTLITDANKSGDDNPE